MVNVAPDPRSLAPSATCWNIGPSLKLDQDHDRTFGEPAAVPAATGGRRSTK